MFHQREETIFYFRDQISYSEDVVNQSRPSLQTPHPNAKSREKAMKTLTAITFRREELNQGRTTAVEGTGKCTEIIIISWLLKIT